MTRVSLTRDPSAPLWRLVWLNPPRTYEWDREGIPSDPYLCGFLRSEDAEVKAAQEGWEIV